MDPEAKTSGLIKPAVPNASHVEESSSPFETSSKDSKEPVSDLKLDAHGLPLVPQPSDHKDDPLVRRIHIIFVLYISPGNDILIALLLFFIAQNWPYWYKCFVLALLCLLAFVVQCKHIPLNQP